MLYEINILNYLIDKLLYAVCDGITLSILYIVLYIS